MQFKIDPTVKLNTYRIMVVDSDDIVRNHIAKILMEMGFSVLVTKSVAEAKDSLKTERVDMVICELRMSQDSGLELAGWVRRVYDTSFRNNMPLPFFLMTGFRHLIEPKEVEAAHIDEVIIKPIHDDELIENILVTLGIAKVVGKNEKPVVDKKFPLTVREREYCRVLMSDFIAHSSLAMDLFIQLSDDKFVKIANKGEPLSDLQFQRYADKGVRFLYLKREDFKKLIDINLRLTQAVKQASHIDLSKKKRFLVKTGEMIMESAFVNGINPETFEEAKDFLCNSLDTLLENDDTFRLLEMLNDHSNHLYAHSLGVSLYSIMIAQQMGWSSSATLFKLSYGALVHDIGKKDLDPDLLKKPKDQLNFDEKMELESHVENGKAILESVRGIPSEVVAIAYEHHENVLGQGYPRFLKRNRISPMARIVSVANEFCNFAIQNPDHPGATAQQAMYLVDKFKNKFLDQDAIAALRAVVKEQKKRTKVS